MGNFEVLSGCATFIDDVLKAVSHREQKRRVTIWMIMIMEK